MDLTGLDVELVPLDSQIHTGKGDDRKYQHNPHPPKIRSEPVYTCTGIAPELVHCPGSFTSGGGKAIGQRAALEGHLPTDAELAFIDR